MSTHIIRLRFRSPQQGFTLIEVMIALLIFSLGLLGTVALQAQVVQMSTQNGDRARAAALANEMVSNLWAHQSSTPDSLYYPNWQTTVSSPTVSGLPNGLGAVGACIGVAVANCATVTITWKAPNAKASAQNSTYTTSVVIQ